MSDTPGPIAAIATNAYGECLNKVCERIIDLDLNLIGGNVWIRSPATIKDITLPAVILSPFTPRHSPQAGTMTAPDIAFGTMVGIVASNAGGVVSGSLADRLNWYTSIFTSFAKVAQPFAITAEDAVLMYTTCEPGDPRVVEAFRAQFDAEWLAVLCHVRYPSTAA